MKKICAAFLVIVLCLTGLPMDGWTSLAMEQKSLYGNRMDEYLEGMDWKCLTDIKNYSYIKMVNDFESDELSLFFLNWCDKLINSGVKPDRKKYIKALHSIIATRDYDNAGKLSNQYKLDNLKRAKDYGMDVLAAVNDGFDIIISTGDYGTLGEDISLAADTLLMELENTENLNEYFSDFETRVKSYSDYDEFLKYIYDHSRGDLKYAADDLRGYLRKSMKTMMNEYTRVSNENFENFGEYFFSDFLFEALKVTADYETDDVFRFYVDLGQDFQSVCESLKASWNLGATFGKLMGDLLTGGEDLINRYLEMAALRDIQAVISDKVLNDVNAYYGSGKNKEQLIRDHVLYSELLVCTHMRGEYCLYSIVAQDAKLISALNGDNRENAEAWIETKNNVLIAIYDNLENIMAGEDSEPEATWLVGLWQIDNYDPPASWGKSEMVLFNEDGTVRQKGARELDKGTYKVIDSNTVEAVYDLNFVGDFNNGQQAVPFEKHDGYVYTVQYEYDHDSDTMTAFYGDLAPDQTAYLTRIPEESEYFWERMEWINKDTPDEPDVKINSGNVLELLINALGEKGIQLDASFMITGETSEQITVSIAYNTPEKVAFIEYYTVDKETGVAIAAFEGPTLFLKD